MKIVKCYFVSCSSRVNPDVTSEYTKLNSRPYQKSCTKNPGTILLVNITNTALIINVNKPNVRIVMGRVSKIRNGLINIFNNPSTSATSSAVENPVTATPGNIYAVIMTASAFTIHFNSIFILFMVPD